MAIEGFNYAEFAQMLSSQAGELVPADFQEFQKKYVINTITNFSNLAGEALYNDPEGLFNIDQAMLITQIIAEWSFHKSVDVIRSGILPDYWDTVMQKIAFTIFEVAKQTLRQGLPQDQVLQLVEHHVKQAYSEALDELASKGFIDENSKENAEHQSNIDVMMDEIQRDKEAAMAAQQGAPAPSGPISDNKILKLASVALLMKQISQDKAQVILDKFSPQDAQTVIQYMQMGDLEQKVDKSIAIKCLREIKGTLPEPRVISPSKIMARLKKAFESRDREKIEIIVRKERPYVKKFIFNAYEGEYYQIPSKVANIIAQHIEDGV